MMHCVEIGSGKTFVSHFNIYTHTMGTQVIRISVLSVTVQWRRAWGGGGSCHRKFWAVGNFFVGNFSFCQKIFVQKCQIWAENAHFGEI